MTTPTPTRVRRVAVQVFAVEILTLLALWALGAFFRS